MKTSVLVNYIIDNIEGGYYHPDMKSKLKNGDRMGQSGETMFGIDRVYGGNLNTSENGKAFWNIVDMYFGNHHADTSYYNDKADGNKKTPAEVGSRLRNLVTSLMTEQLQKNAEMLSVGARKIVFDNPALTLQFLYACWNGSGNFKLFADVLNAAYANGEKSALAFWDLVQAARRKKGGLFADGADKLERIRQKLVNDGSSKKWLIPSVIGAVALFFILKKK